MAPLSHEEEKESDPINVKKEVVKIANGSNMSQALVPMRAANPPAATKVCFGRRRRVSDYSDEDVKVVSSKRLRRNVPIGIKRKDVQSNAVIKKEAEAESEALVKKDVDSEYNKPHPQYFRKPCHLTDTSSISYYHTVKPEVQKYVKEESGLTSIGKTNLEGLLTKDSGTDAKNPYDYYSWQKAEVYETAKVYVGLVENGVGQKDRMRWAKEMLTTKMHLPGGKICGSNETDICSWPLLSGIPGLGGSSLYKTSSWTLSLGDGSHYVFAAFQSHTEL